MGFGSGSFNISTKEKNCSKEKGICVHKSTSGRKKFRHVPGSKTRWGKMDDRQWPRRKKTQRKISRRQIFWK